jgi:hypothetical protein
VEYAEITGISILSGIIRAEKKSLFFDYFIIPEKIKKPFITGRIQKCILAFTIST